MTDVLIYWRDYRHNWIRQFAGERSCYWHSKAKVLGNLQPGDHMWMVTSGVAVGNVEKQAGFLVAIWTVKQAIENPGDDPAYPYDDYRYRIVADPDQEKAFPDPVLVDEILRPPGQDKSIPIGRFMQGPRKLQGNTLRLLRAAAGPDLALKWLTGDRENRRPEKAHLTNKGCND